MDLVLASASPRRRELLAAAGFLFSVVSQSVDETPRAGETPREHVRRLARAKALAVARERPSATVLGADTVVALGDEILGKPADAADARRMLARLSGRGHQVYTGVALWREGHLEDAVEVSDVEMVELGREEIDRYIASGEPFDKAGAYAIQGLASRYITRINGSYSNVVGLPIAVIYQWLKGSAGSIVESQD